MSSTVSPRTLLCMLVLALWAIQLAGPPAPARAAVMAWPAESSAVVPNCAFNQRCQGTSSAPYHSGLDLYGGTKRILAAGDGPIVAVISNGSNDHGLGNTIIQEIDTAWGRRYALYGHLAGFSRTAGCVRRGEQLGTMGGSGYGQPNRWGTHLHFEIKTRPVLQNPSGAGPYWGYMPSPAQNYGYEDPLYWLRNVPATGACTLPYAAAWVTQEATPPAMAPGAAFTYKLTWRNTGTATLYNTGTNPTRCRASHPTDRHSAWINTSDPRAVIDQGVAIDQTKVAPGQTFTCTLPLKAPSARISDEYWAVVTEGKTWMLNNGNDDVWVRLTSA